MFVAPSAADEPKAPVPVDAPVALPSPSPLAPASAPDRIAEALAPQPGGLTPIEAGRLVLIAKPSLRVKEAEVREAAAKVDAALLNFIPRVTGTATYTRLSEVQNSLGTQTVFGLNTGDPTNPFNPNIPTGGLVNGACPAPAPSSFSCVHLYDAGGRDQGTLAVTQVPFNFPVLLNSYSFAAQVAVPISDYLLRISQAHSALSHIESAKKYDLEVAKLQAVADAKVAFFNWARFKGAVVVAQEAYRQADVHLTDIRRVFDAGLVSKADVLRLEAQKAAAELGIIDMTAAANTAELNVQVLLGLPTDKPLTIGIDIFEDIRPSSDTTASARTLEDEAFVKRLELRALRESERGAEGLVDVSRANYLPRVDGFAQTTYANPNQRFFPQKDEFRFTWEAGVRVSWTVNDTLAAPAGVREAKARVAQIAAFKEQLVQGLKMEVIVARGDLARAEASLEAAKRGLVAAEETLRVQSELLRAGRATSTTIVDAEAAVTQARLRHVDARVAILVARTRLDHVLGRDVPKS